MGPFPPPAYEARYISTVWNFIKFFLDWVLAFAGVVFLVLSFVGYRLAEVKARCKKLAQTSQGKRKIKDEVASVTEDEVAMKLAKVKHEKDALKQTHWAARGGGWISLGISEPK